MVVQLSFLFFLVAFAVASTRLIYIDAFNRHLLQLERHCRILSALIVATAIYAGSIGFSVHEQCMMLLNQKAQQSVVSSEPEPVIKKAPSMATDRESITLSRQ